MTHKHTVNVLMFERKSACQNGLELTWISCLSASLSFNSVSHKSTHRETAALPPWPPSQTMNRCSDAVEPDRSGLAVPPPFMAKQSNLPAAARADQSTCELLTTSKPQQHPVKSSKHDRVEQHLVLMGEKVNQKIQLHVLWLHCGAITACTCSDICLCVFTYLRYESHSIIWIHFESGVRRSDFGINCCVTSHCMCMKNHCR